MGTEGGGEGALRIDLWPLGIWYDYSGCFLIPLFPTWRRLRFGGGSDRRGIHTFPTFTPLPACLSHRLVVWMPSLTRWRSTPAV